MWRCSYTCCFFFFFFSLGRGTEFLCCRRRRGTGLLVLVPTLWLLYHLFPIVEILVALASVLSSPIPATSGPAHTHMLDRPGRVAPCLTRLKTFLVLREVMGWGFSIYRIKLSHLLLSPGRDREETFSPWDYH